MNTPMTGSQQACYSGRLFRRCHEATVGSCQFCGRPFCPRHGDMLEEGQQVCHRQLCQRKVADLGAHKAYLELVSLRNSKTMCGLPDCSRQPWGQCSHCQALFCRSHIHPRLRSVRREGITVQEPVSVCDHCWLRHQLWVEV